MLRPDHGLATRFCQKGRVNGSSYLDSGYSLIPLPVTGLDWTELVPICLKYNSSVKHYKVLTFFVMFCHLSCRQSILNSCKSQTVQEKQFGKTVKLFLEAGPLNTVHCIVHY